MKGSEKSWSRTVTWSDVYFNVTRASECIMDCMEGSYNGTWEARWKDVGFFCKDFFLLQEFVHYPS